MKYRILPNYTNIRCLSSNTNGLPYISVHGNAHEFSIHKYNRNMEKYMRQYNRIITMVIIKCLIKTPNIHSIPKSTWFFLSPYVCYGRLNLKLIETWRLVTIWVCVHSNFEWTKSEIQMLSLYLRKRCFTDLSNR